MYIWPLFPLFLNQCSNFMDDFNGILKEISPLELSLCLFCTVIWDLPCGSYISYEFLCSYYFFTWFRPFFIAMVRDFIVIWLWYFVYLYYPPLQIHADQHLNIDLVLVKLRNLNRIYSLCTSLALHSICVLILSSDL